ncbi:putative ribonuclease H-like domain-containing protein [Tanacetum coccineum]
MWESAKTVAPTPNYAIIRPDVDDNFVINAPISLKEKMHEMRKNYNNRGGNPVSKNYDTLMCESHEENYIQSEVCVELSILATTLNRVKRSIFNWDLQVVSEPTAVREILARERERKARTTLLMALPKDHLAKFHKMTDAKEMWEAIKSRFGGNDESKKMHKYIIKQQFDGFSCSHEDENQKFFRSLPSAWSQVSLIMRTKPRVGNLSFDDLYNNLRVFESDVKGSTASSSSMQNVEFVSENTSSTNDVSTAYGVSTSTDPRESRIVGGEMLRTLGIKIKKIGGDLVNKKNLKLCNSGSDTKGTSFSKECKESYAKLKKLYDEQREQLGDASIEIQAYTQALKKVEAQLVGHQQNQLWYEEKIRFMKIDLDDKTDMSVRDKDGLGYGDQMNLLNTQMSANDKFGLGYRDHIYDGILSYEDEVLQSVFINKESELEKQPLYDRFVTARGMHAVPPPMTGNYMPSRPDVEIDYSQFTYDCSVETHESLPEPTINEPKVVNQPKVWSDAPIIEEYASDSEDEHVSLPTEEHETPIDKKGLGYGFVTKACFVCGRLSHLIRDCDFHEKRMAKQVEVNNRLRKKSSQRKIRPIWNNVQRVNHQNQFVPTAVLTRIGKIPVSIARVSNTNNVSTTRHNFNRQALPTNAAMKVNTVKPIVNRVRPKTVFHKTHSPFSRPFNNTTALRTNFSYQKVNTAEVNAVSAVGGRRETADYPHRALQNKGIVDSGCSRHMTGNKAYLVEYQDFNGGPVAFGGSKGYITGKGKIKTGKLDFEDVCFVKELQHFNLFSVSQICDKKNKVLFTDSECLVLSPEFKLPDANQVLLRIPRQNNMYSFNLENIVPSGGLACLIAKGIIDESNKWHRSLGHVNFKNLNKLVKGNLVRGLPSKIFQNDHTCVACQKGKQHKASCKAKSVSSISHSLQLLHMDLFGPTSVRSLNHKTYCLVITDDFSRFSWVFFLRTKDETSGILKDFIRQIENQLNQKVKTIRCDNGTEFKNRDFIEFCGSKGIKREYSNARTPQQNGVAERKNRTLIEAARTMLADSFLPNTFWAEAVSTACYVLNRVLVTKPHNKTPYELVTGKIPIISYIRPFGCHVTILNTIDHLGKFDGKSDEGFLVGELTTYEIRESSKQTCSPQKLIKNAGTEDIIDAGDSEKEAEYAQDYFVIQYGLLILQQSRGQQHRMQANEKDANEQLKLLGRSLSQETEDCFY